MSPIKLFTKAIIFVLCISLPLSITPIAEAGMIQDFKSNIKTERVQSTQTTKPENQIKVKPIIKKDKNGKKKIDFEPNIKMSKDQERDFENCKSEELTRRSKRNINKPTACRKEIKSPDVEISDQEYAILVDRIQEKNDIDTGKDMDIELPIEVFIDIKDLEVCEFVIDTISSISQTSSISSDNDCSSTNQSSIISSSSSSSNSSNSTNSSSTNISSSILSSSSISSIEPI
jgi:hypothetical protein